MNSIRRFAKENLGPYLRNKNKKSPVTQLAETVSLYNEYRYIPYHYFKSTLFTTQSPPNILAYIPPKLIERCSRELNYMQTSPELARNFRDKVRFEKTMAEHGIPCVRTIAFVDEEGRLLDRDGKPIEAAALRGAAGPSSGKLFAKPRRGGGGKGAMVLDLESDAQALTGLRDYIIQPLITQHPEVSQLFPHAINTVRIDTFRLAERCVHNAAVLRIGTGRSNVDNWDLGAIAVGIDLETGRLMRIGRRKNKFGDQKGYDAHPDSGIRFENRQLPYWAQTRQLACAAAAAASPLRSIGWDIAITEAGPVLIEGNAPFDISLLQAAWGGLRDTPIGQYALKSRTAPERP